MKANNNLKKIVTISLMAALVLVFSKLEIRLTDGARIHLGNGMCLLSGLMLSPMSAGLASGIGSLFFDLLFYPNSFAIGFLVTFITKFLMSFICSLVFRGLSKLKVKNNVKIINGSIIDNMDILSSLGKMYEYVFIILSAIIGQIIYIILYLIKSFIENYYLLKQTLEVVKPLLIIKLSSSVLNAIFAVIMATLLYQVVKKIKI